MHCWAFPSSHEFFSGWLVWILYYRAIYTGIKKTSFFSHSSFSLEVARQLPLNAAKIPNRKNPPLKCGFLKLCQFLLFFANGKRSLPSRRYYSGFWSRGTWPSRESPAAHYVLRTMVKGSEKSCMRTTYQKTRMRFFFFSPHALFLPKTPKVMGFSGSVNGKQKTRVWGGGGIFCFLRM